MMANDSKLGMMAGVAVVLLVAVFFHNKPAVGTAYIGNDAAATAPERVHSTPPLVPPAGVTVPENASRSIWQATEPREIQPVSRDPLLWP